MGLFVSGFALVKWRDTCLRKHAWREHRYNIRVYKTRRTLSVAHAIVLTLEFCYKSLQNLAWCQVWGHYVKL